MLWSLVALSLTTSSPAHTLAATMSDSRYGADAHNTDYERGREDERAAIAAWLRASGAVEDDAVADAVEAIGNSIERGDHLAGDDE
jgi:hypothetical protein